MFMKNSVMSAAICIASIAVIVSSQTVVLAQVGGVAIPARPDDPVILNPRPTMVSWERGKFTVTKFTKIMYSGDAAKAEAEALANNVYAFAKSPAQSASDAPPFGGRKKFRPGSPPAAPIGKLGNNANRDLQASDCPNKSVKLAR